MRFDHLFWLISCPAFINAGETQQPAETPHTRKVFYVGGSYTTDSSGSHAFKGQMYVEHLMPIGGRTQPYPLVFYHGLGQTGTNWLTKPDGDPGWASYFLAHGYECYVVDIPARGRSPWLLQPSLNLSDWIQAGAEVIQQRFTAPENYNIYPTAKLHTQWPSGYGKGVMGDPIFDAYYASTAPTMNNPILQQNTVQETGTSLLERINTPVILVAHSQGGIAPWVIADRKPELVKKIVALEPAGPPFQEPAVLGNKRDARAWGLSDIPITYEPPVTNPSMDFVKVRIPASNTSEECVLQADDPPPRQLVNFKNIKTVVVQAEASWHPLYDWCTVKFLKQAGGDVELLDLAAENVRGNGHMMMLEKNSDDVAEVIRSWIESS